MSARTRTIWTFAITSAAVFMATLDNLVVTTALPVIREDLHASIESLEWTVNAYTLTFAVMLLTGAALGDRFGRRRMLAVASGGLLGIVWGLVRGNGQGWTSPEIVTSLAGGAIVLALFALWELRTD